jgi:2,3-bisphosphoglycerate-independent phosphoglycerate mutase
VELIYISSKAKERKLKPGGKLADIAPTVLKLMDLAIPKEMTATQLIEEL